MNCEITICKKQVTEIDSESLPVGAYFVVRGGVFSKLYQKIESSSPPSRHVDCSTGAVSYANIQDVLRVYPKISVEVDA